MGRPGTAAGARGFNGRPVRRRPVLPPSGAAFLIDRPEAGTWPSRLSPGSPAILLIPIAVRPLAADHPRSRCAALENRQTLPAGEAADFRLNGAPTLPQLIDLTFLRPAQEGRCRSGLSAGARERRRRRSVPPTVVQVRWLPFWLRVDRRNHRDPVARKDEWREPAGFAPGGVTRPRRCPLCRSGRCQAELGEQGQAVAVHLHRTILQSWTSAMSTIGTPRSARLPARCSRPATPPGLGEYPSLRPARRRRSPVRRTASSTLRCPESCRTG